MVSPIRPFDFKGCLFKMKKLCFVLLVLGGCQAAQLSTATNNGSENKAQGTTSVASAGGMTTYGSGNSATPSNISGEGNSGQIEGAGGFGGEAAGGRGATAAAAPSRAS